MKVGNKYKSLCKLVANCPKGMETNWFVITGAPCSGKTTLIRLLAHKGYKICPDASRQLLELRLKSGLLPKQARADEAEFQMELLGLMVNNLLQLKTSDCVFHEYALPDNVAFWRRAGLELPEVLMQSTKIFKYQEIFALEPLPLVRDGIRTENEADQKAIHGLILECYREAGYNPIIIPVSSVESRLENIMKHVPE